MGKINILRIYCPEIKKFEDKFFKDKSILKIKFLKINIFSDKYKKDNFFSDKFSEDKFF